MMKRISPLVILAAVLAVAALLPGSELVSRSTWAPAQAFLPVFLQQPGGGAWTSAAPPGTARSHLPSSTMPHTNMVCSVDTSDPATPNYCSSNASSPAPCSAHCDSGQQCSAFTVSGGSNGSLCSAQSVGVCSVLQPAVPAGSPTICSASDPTGVTPPVSVSCSITGTGAKQQCTSENPQRLKNLCSTFGIATTSAPQCSVLGGGTASANYCSVGRQPVTNSKLCSAFAAGMSCSIDASFGFTNRGACTAFKGAPANACSAFASTAFCSVIGGAAGKKCKQP